MSAAALEDLEVKCRGGCHDEPRATVVRPKRIPVLGTDEQDHGSIASTGLAVYTKLDKHLACQVGPQLRSGTCPIDGFACQLLLGSSCEIKPDHIEVVPT